MQLAEEGRVDFFGNFRDRGAFEDVSIIEAFSLSGLDPPLFQ